MNSAGQNNFTKENQKRMKVQLTNQDKENKRTREDANKKKLNPVRSKSSLGAIKKVNQQSTSRNSCGYCVCNCCPRNVHSFVQRQPLGDVLNVNRNSQAPVNKTVLKRAASVREKSTSSELFYSSISTYKSASEAFYTPKGSSQDDNEFWTSFLLVDDPTDAPSVRRSKFMQKVEDNKQNFSIVHDSIPSVRKKTLKKHVSCFSGHLGVVNLDPHIIQDNPITLYSIEYMNDIIFYIIKRQKRNILMPKFLDKNSYFLDNRASVINWLIKLHQYAPGEAGVLFMCIRLFDKILTLLDVPASHYQLTAMTTYWISVKYRNSTNFITGPTLVKFCNNAFSLKSLLEMEKNILLILQFDIIIDDPIIFIYYFIYILQLYESNIIGYCASYLLEILTLDFNCNTFSLSLQAASAVFLALKFFEIQDRVWRQVEDYYGYHERAEMFPVQKIMIKNIILTSHEDCPYKETFRKYSTEKYGKVSIVIPKILERWYNVTDISELIL